jgi:ribosome biogenesis GTPase
VVAAFGRRLLVETEQGETLSCVTRGRRTGIVCGDWVRVSRTAAGEGVIEDVQPRTSLVYRSDAKREKAIAANADQIVVVLAVAPAPNVDFLDRCIVAAEHAGIATLLLLNKIDLAPDGGPAAAILAAYRALGYRTATSSKTQALDALLAELRGRTSVFVGQSGVGKSTLVNRLVPQAAARVGDTSSFRDAGRHTTTHAQLYALDASSGIIDSPGMHAFGLNHVAPEDLASCFLEMRPLLQQCRFSNCRHDGEPGCAIDEAARQGRITPARLQSYRRILASIGQGNYAG